MTIDHDAAGLDQNAPGGGNVPGPGAALPEGVLLAGGDAADGDGGGAGAAEGVDEAAAGGGGAEEGGEDFEVEGEVGAVAVGAEVDGDAGGGEAVEGKGGAEGLRIVVIGVVGIVDVVALCGVCPVALDGGPELVAEGIVHDADGGLFLDDEGNGDGDVGEAVDEVGRAVYGVDDEGWLVGDGLARVVGFFADEGEGRVVGGEIAADEGFDCFVGLGDDVGGWKGDLRVSMCSLKGGY